MLTIHDRVMEFSSKRDLFPKTWLARAYLKSSRDVFKEYLEKLESKERSMKKEAELTLHQMVARKRLAKESLERGIG